MGRESLILSFFSAGLLRSKGPFLSSTQIRAVRLLRAGSEGHDLSSTVTNDPIAPSRSLRQPRLPNHEEPVATSAPLADRFGAGLIAGRRARLELTVHRVRLCSRIRNSELGRPGRQCDHQCMFYTVDNSGLTSVVEY
jgi:hypothetical protein